MRFLAIVSVFFAVTHVAFATVDLPPSPHTISTSACVGAVGVIVDVTDVAKLAGHVGMCSSSFKPTWDIALPDCQTGQRQVIVLGLCSYNHIDLGLVMPQKSAEANLKLCTCEKFCKGGKEVACLTWYKHTECWEKIPELPHEGTHNENVGGGQIEEVADIFEHNNVEDLMEHEEDWNDWEAKIMAACGVPLVTD
ncbi:hypothetical protein K439DRAFT_1513643 [Ramaria rubella]|nr:hypothetical protein K439DRAFT_1513643 [Ramaria rubella]